MVLGITGISGAGKHTAAAFFSQRKWVVLDVDKIAHHLYRPYTHVWKAVVKRFGEGVLTQNDTVDRQKLGKIVFDERDPRRSLEELSALNQIVHPAIKRYLKDRIHRHFRCQSNIVVVAALLEEISLSSLCDQVLLVAIDLKLAQQRIMARDGISEAAYRSRVRHQSIPSKPDFVVENNGTVKELYQALARLKLEKPEK